MLSRRSFVGLLAVSALPAMARAPADRRAVIDKAADLIRDRYVDPVAGRRIAAQLRGRRDLLASEDAPAVFAKRVTTALRAISGDGHFALTHDPAAKAVADGDVIDPAELDRWYGPGVNHGFEQVARLDGGIGYLDLRAFAPIDMAGDMAAAAMTLLAQSPALIIDLRKNGGGMDAMTRLLAAYLLDDVREMSGTYNRPAGRTQRFFTSAQVPGRRFGGAKPVYILTSRRTFSAAEAFAYDLQAMKRAAVVGERTGGGAHPFAYRPVLGGFVLSLPEGRSINPITGKDWEGTGVTPDIPVAADSALHRALALAKERLKSGS